MSWELGARLDFSAAHALRNYRGKCERKHGHNFTAEIRVRGSRLRPDTEILLDFKILKGILKDALETLDHRDLNETPPFDKINPSSENLAKYLFEEAQKRLAVTPEATNARLISVSVWEKEGQSATWIPDSKESD